MAALFDCGNGSALSAQMHPFFQRRAPYGHAHSDPRFDTPRRLDGNTHPDGNTANSTPSDMPPPPYSYNTPEVVSVFQCHPMTSTYLQSEGAPQGISDESHMDDEHRRAKRRKMCPEADAPQFESSSTKQSWQTQLEDAAMQAPGSGQSQIEGHDNMDTLPEYPQAHVNNTWSGPGPLNMDPYLASLAQAPYPTVEFSDAPRHDIVVENSIPTEDAKTARSDDPPTVTSTLKTSVRRSPRTKRTDVDRLDMPRRVARQGKKVEMKNGKFVSTLRVVLTYGDKEAGQRIDEILSAKPAKASITTVPQDTAKIVTEKKATHPFFLGKTTANTDKLPSVKSEMSSLAPASEDETATTKAPKPWKDIVFTTKKTSPDKSINLLPSLWPPTSLQRIQPECPLLYVPTTPSSVVAVPKSKQRDFIIPVDEDALRICAERLKEATDLSTSVDVPTRRIMSGKELSLTLDCHATTAYGSIARLETLRQPLIKRIQTRPSPFELGKAAGPHLWPQEYGPTCWQEVLQEQSQVLYDWLSNLQVHHVQTGAQMLKTKPTAKKRRKRKTDELDDFIAHSDDDEDQSLASHGKNAILIVGPCGCGKTASVYAIAQQLGFEVFEMHPGMRRSARDIQEKVGDMTQNHLVQQADTQSRRSSVSSAAPETSLLPEASSTNQTSIASLWGMSKPSKQKGTTDNNKQENKVRSQKQSLILFEEVDILFEEDKGFWSGVQSLISSSKRPVIMTCNSLESVPLDDLDIFTVLAFDRPEPVLAVDQLQCIAAAEGHLLSRESIEKLYASKGHDLRASITELNLWCQMTVGSRQGGLDWMLPHNTKSGSSQDDSVLRIISQDTYTPGLDLLPTEYGDIEDTIRLAQDGLGVPAVDWIRGGIPVEDPNGRRLNTLDAMLSISEARSAMDLLSAYTSPTVAAIIEIASGGGKRVNPREKAFELVVERLTKKHISRLDVTDAFEMLMEDYRIALPMAPGRKAPSLDNAAQSVVTDVAPYVRNIVSHDQRLEQIRNELSGGPQVKRQRKTRAARAALEGGNKGTTRRDRWFPDGLDFSAVLATGNAWPQLGSEESYSGPDTPSSSMATDLDGDVVGQGPG
ncbi:hypothetical protein PV08_01684 [Exophiala spinifera]|uniref:AAA+ ATPase domain-containing protein n=1 Tax=Exophiala spinifera TaxID=91928 RepID=A0A0D2BRS7_9EURO|nr:uncharacterized protein PV08_01684 [Exophiala spinifera]KIW21105.1 hypothetical protein PV08_01684 [Exophiala spinifera]